MTAEDRLRSRLRGVASSMAVGDGALTDVQTRALRRQRRKNAVLGGAGMLSLAALAMAGFGFYQSSVGPAAYETVADSGTAPALAELETAADSQGAPQDAQDAQDAVSGDLAGESSQTGSALAAAAPATGDADGGDAAAGSQGGASEGAGVLVPIVAQDEADEEHLAAAGLASEEEWSGEFGLAVSMVAPPPGVDAAEVRYSFSGDYVLANSGDDWFAYDGISWSRIETPEGMSVVAVDLTGTERIAVLGTVRPTACSVAHLVAVQTAAGWRFTRIDDGTPAAVHSEMTDGWLMVSDTYIEVERTETLRLNSECLGEIGNESVDADGAELLRWLRNNDRLTRESSHFAVFVPDFASVWLPYSTVDPVIAATHPGLLEWGEMATPEYSLGGGGPSNSPISLSITRVLEQTLLAGVPTTVEVTDGVAYLHRGGQTWDICHVPEAALADGQVGWAGERLAVVMTLPEPLLFAVDRAA